MSVRSLVLRLPRQQRVPLVRCFGYSAVTRHASHNSDGKPIYGKFPIPESQKAMVFDKPRGPIQLRDVPVPKPDPDEVLINVKYSGVCHTDLHAWKGDWPIPTKLPLIGGHEGAGVVVGKGHLVRNFEIGDLAGIKWLNGSCGTCEFCKETHESNCPEAILSGYTVDGSFQQYAIAKAIQAAPIPAGTDLVQVAPILCAGLTVYTAIRESGVRAGQWLAVTGAGGGLGTLAIQYAKAMGIRVVGIDSGSAKEEWCKKLGATEFIDFTKTKNLKDTIQQVTGGGPHAVVNVAASEKPINEAIEYLRSRGTAVLVGLPPQAVAHADVFSSVLRSITIKGSYVGNRSQTDDAIGFFSRGDIHMPIKVVGLSELPMVYDLMEKRQIEGRYVLDTSR